ncbi:hypothetical protein F5Y12DRAFT_789529 [Xylaria sp. FL1777]|nr:hypothetical protein F5Y12DRAFT_789529 [Xylaria sp. FL1777]
MTAQERLINTVTVEPGSKTKFYFIPITGLQTGTNFRDVWLHLKKVVKRLEHIEIYPSSTEGWICVHTLREPVLVQATNTSSLITPSEKNNDQKITIRLPVNCSDHVSTVIDHATGPKDLPEPVIADTESQASSIQETSRRYEVVIAHGTYKPGIAPGSANMVGSNTSQSSQSTCTAASSVYQPSPASVPPFWSGSYESFQHPAYADHQWYPPSPILSSDTQFTGLFAPWVPTKPTMKRSYLVLLSNLPWNATVYQVEALVRWAAKMCRLEDRRIQTVNGNTVVMKTRGDARRLRDELNGYVLNGIPIKAQIARQLPPVFATHWPDWTWRY